MCDLTDQLIPFLLSGLFVNTHLYGPSMCFVALAEKLAQVKVRMQLPLHVTMMIHIYTPTGHKRAVVLCNIIIALICAMCF